MLILLLAGSTASAADVKIMIFGGKGHDVYLGCLNCPETAPDSIFNPNGKFGRCSSIYDDNLFCRGLYSEYGGKGLYKDQSACGSNAGDPPVIVDENGGYYGRFSLGGLYGHNDSVCASIYGKFRNEAVCEIVQRVCGQ